MVTDHFTAGRVPRSIKEKWGRLMSTFMLDNRGLEPPEPMMRTLAKLDELAPGDVLVIHNDRLPAFLLPELDDRGYAYEAMEQDDGSYQVRIEKPAS